MARRIEALSVEQIEQLDDDALLAYLGKLAPEIRSIEERRADLYDARRSAMWVAHVREIKQAAIARAAEVGTQAVAFQLHKARKDAVAG